jgi:hypothetical protein
MGATVGADGSGASDDDSFDDLDKRRRDAKRLKGFIGDVPMIVADDEDRLLQNESGR